MSAPLAGLARLARPEVYLRRPAGLASQRVWWIAGRRVELADLSQLPAFSPVFSRGRNYALCEATLYVRSLATLDEGGATRLLSQMMRFRVEALVAKYEKVFGVAAEKVTIRPMRSRWGSCRPGRRALTFNLHLVHLADELLEYVVIHEFVHFFVHGHGKDFYALLQQHCPDWKTRRQMLNTSIGG